VLLVDGEADRARLVSQVVGERGASVLPFAADVSRELRPASARCWLAFVAAEGGRGASLSPPAVIGEFKRAGFQVVAYADQATAWPLRTRCLPLLAGASHLLDSAHGNFQTELRTVLAEQLAAAARREEEERQLKTVMAGLGVIGESPATLDVFRTILHVSVLSDVPVLLTGATGTGKECLARALHRLDPKRAQGPFVAVNCAAITPTLAESELFGHRRGAFTGAERERRGLIRAAEGGVLFLDEIGEMTDALQAKLLRVVQERRVLTVGEEHERPVNVRILAATNRELPELVRQGKFRADLFHRLNIVSVRVPPLRERPENLWPLADFFLAKHRWMRATGALTVSKEFVEALVQADLPGNVRELENLVCRALVHKATDTPLGLGDLPAEVLERLCAPSRAASQQGSAPAPADAPSGPGSAPEDELPERWLRLPDRNEGSLWRSLESCERALLAAALERTHGNQSQAARMLGITPRSVYNKVHKYRLTHQRGD
jgi:transcriptional regulator with GAF, ATPase, and Fis domain